MSSAQDPRPDRDGRDRELDLVLVGATGFTGGLTAEHLARHAPPGLRWGLAGRDPGRLERVRDRLTAIDPACAELPLRHAEAGDRASLDALAASTRVVATTVGPYLRHGADLVAACADAGTDYADLTGEPEFVDRMYVDHHDRAVETGARLVHACGFDSVPHDLGAQFTVEQLPEGVPLELRGVVRTSGTFSGGTWNSALEAMSRPVQTRAARDARRRVEPQASGRRVRASVGRPHRDPVTGYWLVPLPTIDPAVVVRSAAALHRYGPDFRYGHYAGTRRLVSAAAGVGAVTGLTAAAQVGPLRRTLAARMPSGQGPDEERRARSRFSVRFVGEGGGVRVCTQVSGGDPGYTETATMLAQSALSLALDDLPPTAGQVTPAVAMGPALRERLQAAGIDFRVTSTERL